jgi:mono/diheme cytochrome c family protein
MAPRQIALAIAVLTLACSAMTDARVRAERPATQAKAVSFADDIEPLFARRCLSCHGPKKQESDLRLDVRAALLQGGDFGEPSVVPGDSSASFLIQVISGENEDLAMPPKGPRLTADEIALIRDWIDAGAAMPAGEGHQQKQDHWSFQPLVQPVPPLMDDPWVRTPIDGFVLERLQANKLSPSPAANRVMLIRRLYLVMLGVLPTPDEVVQFTSDVAPRAYERLVERVLASPRYGERWARHWLDVVRFGETHGFETNRERPNAWRYRDYVIDAFNADTPYDQFVKEQLAGDGSGADVATGFLVAGPYDQVKGKDINSTLIQRQDELADMINATGTTFLGLTLGCARCHNHKFDPISQTDYYAMQAIFAGVHHGDRPLPPSATRRKQLAMTDVRIRELRQQLARFIPSTSAVPRLRPAVNSKRNVEQIQPIKARFVRFTIHATNGAEPCLDELQVWSGDVNVAAASAGGRATCSSTLPGYPIHQLEHINDGRFGNAHSWISNERGKGWIQIEFAEPASIDRIEWGRDREEKYRDRLAIDYTIEAAVEPGRWTEIASSADRLPATQGKSAAIKYRFADVDVKVAELGRAWLDALNRAVRRREQLAVTPISYAGKFQQPGPTHRLYRGEPTAKREVVVANAPRQFSHLGLKGDTPEQLRRTKLAEWIVATDNPLTARTLVNRLWHYQFGVGMVDTPNDLGVNGTRPIHPKLLDWLASEAIRSEWSLKHLHRLVVLSSTFRQSSQPRKEGLASDGDSRLLWRFPPRRLEAEAIRDNILAVSGVLNLRMGGPGFSAFEVQLENVRHYFPKKSYGPADWRRMIYMTKVRQEQDSVFGVFDCPDASQAVPRRSRSTTPLQALNLFNSVFSMDQSRYLEARLQSEAPRGVEPQVQRAFALTFSRRATANELHSSIEFIESHGLAAFCRAMLNTNEFLFIP